MTKWNDPKSMTMTFQVEPTEESVEFFKRMEQEMKDREQAFKERIQQLFDEEIEVGGAKKDAAYSQVLRVFAIGYQHGWNDHYKLTENKEGKA